MPIRVGFLGVAHMHALGYAAALRTNRNAELACVWDSDAKRRLTFAREADVLVADSAQGLLENCDAVVITSTNKAHVEDVELAARAGKAILCEKPLVTTEDEARHIVAAVERAGVTLMTAFPCRYAPTYTRLKERVRAGDIGAIRAVCATNRGRCPFDWFVDPEQSGGGAMIDHTVHVADLLRDLLGDDPLTVQAQVGSNMYGQEWEDTAMLTLDFPNGAFATIDSSWSRPQGYKTWGDVTLNVVGEKGVIEIDLFAQEVEVYGSGFPSHAVTSYGSSLDALLVEEFLSCIEEDRPPLTTMHDGIQATRIAIAGYHSVHAGVPVHLTGK